jgi:hypothetical protein
VPLFPPEVADLLGRCAQPDALPRERGALLEELVAVAFATVPGIEVRARNAKSVFDNEEFDLVMTNREVEDGVFATGPFFSVECKNWSRPVGSAELSWFATKLRRSGQRFGVLVAANGVTGSRADMTAAHFEAATALSEGQAVVVLTLTELSLLASGEELADLLAEKHLCLVARRELHFRETPVTPTRLPRPSHPQPTHAERDDVLTTLADEVAVAPDLIRSLDVTVAHYRETLETFLRLEYQEPEADAAGGEEFGRWAERNVIAFEQLEDALKRLARACIAGLRGADLAAWPSQRLALGMDIRAPANLDAPPDSELAELLLGHWTAAAADTGHGRETALLCLLAWTLENLIAVQTQRWPPPWA